MLELFSVNNIAFTILGYPMSYIEFIGTILYLWSVWLIARKQMLTWPVGIVSVLLYITLFTRYACTQIPSNRSTIWEQACMVGGGGVHLVEVQAKPEISGTVRGAV
jgi:hypothetical protein